VKTTSQNSSNSYKLADAVVEFYKKEILPKIVHKCITIEEASQLLQSIYYYFSTINLSREELIKIVKKWRKIKLELGDAFCRKFYKLEDEVEEEYKDMLLEITDDDKYVNPIGEPLYPPRKARIYYTPIFPEEEDYDIYQELIGLINFFIITPKLVEAVLTRLKLPKELRRKVRYLQRFFTRSIVEKYRKDRISFAVKA